MVSFLNRLIWVLSIFIVVSLSLIDFDYMFVGFIAALFFRFILFSRWSIEQAVLGMHPSPPLELQTDVIDFEDVTSEIMRHDSPEVQDMEISQNSEGEKSLPLSLEREPEIQSQPYEKATEPEEPSRFSVWIHEFFSDRPLAKV